MKKIVRGIFSKLSGLFSDKHQAKLAKLFSFVFPKVFARKFVKQLYGNATKEFLTLLLKTMDLAFVLSKDYRRNIERLEADYVFETEDKTVGVTASFHNGNMKVTKSTMEKPTVKILFKNANALKNYIFSTNQNIIDSLLKNEVRAVGNVNYIFKFGYMALDLERRMGLIG